MKTNEQKESDMTTTYRGYRIAGDRCGIHSVEHYSGGDMIVAERLRSGELLLWRAWAPDNQPVHGPGRAFASLEAARRAVDRTQESRH